LGEIGKKKKEKVQFAIVFYFLKEHCPMTSYEPFKDFFYFLKIKNMPKKHWSNILGWEIAKNTCMIVLQHAKEVVKESPFLALSADEVTTTNNESWISIHGYVFKNIDECMFC